MQPEHIELRSLGLQVATEGERAGKARAEQRAAQRQRHHVLGALVVAGAPYVGHDEHRVRLGHDAAEHAVARRVVVVQARRVEQPNAARAQRARRADGERAAQGHAPHERPQRAVVRLVGRVHVRPAAPAELRRALGAQLEALAELRGHGGVRHQEVHRALQRHAFERAGRRLALAVQEDDDRPATLGRHAGGHEDEVRDPGRGVLHLHLRAQHWGQGLLRVPPQRFPVARLVEHGLRLRPGGEQNN